jgi:hypothetical protein
MTTQCYMLRNKSEQTSINTSKIEKHEGVLILLILSLLNYLRTPQSARNIRELRSTDRLFLFGLLETWSGDIWGPYGDDYEEY